MKEKLDKVFTLHASKETISDKYYKLFSGNSNLTKFEIEILRLVNDNAGRWDTSSLLRKLQVSSQQLNNYKKKLKKRSCIYREPEDIDYKLDNNLKLPLTPEKKEYRIMFVIKVDPAKDGQEADISGLQGDNTDLNSEIQ